MSNGNFDYKFKIAFIGNVGVGKTSIMTRFTRRLFIERHSSTVGNDNATRILVIDGCRIQLQVWDTAGQERFRTITQSYYRNANGLLVAYDITNYESLDGLTEWIEDVKRYANPDVLMVLVGTKKDLENEKREVAEEKAKKFASNYPNVVDVIETSSKNDVNIDIVFEKLATALKTQRESRKRSYSTRSDTPDIAAGRSRKDTLARFCKLWHCCG